MKPAIPRHEYLEQQYFENSLNSLKEKFRKQGWAESFVENVTLDDAHFVSYEMPPEPDLSKSDCMDYVDVELGHTVLPEERIPNPGSPAMNGGRPTHKTVSFMGRQIRVSYYHSGTVMSVHELD